MSTTSRKPFGMSRCTIEFTGGTLEGLTYENHWLPYEIAKVGHEVKKPVAGSPYRVVAVFSF